jgi:uncharacterized protein (TIGR02444 family)
MSTDLWRFAQDFYQRPGVETACLQLQAQGADVCLLICAAWLGRRGVACSATRAERLRAAAEPWQREVIGALRQIRQDWRTAARHDGELATLREQLKQLELQAERMHLQRLASLSDAWPAEAAQDMRDWLEELAPAVTTAGRDALQRLRVAAQQP